ncbi:MAG: hypothetical protein ACPLXL_01550 [Minisyncoccia bacterium]
MELNRKGKGKLIDLYEKKADKVIKEEWQKTKKKGSLVFPLSKLIALDTQRLRLENARLEARERERRRRQRQQRRKKNK